MTRRISATATFSAVNNSLPIRTKNGHKIVARVESGTFTGLNVIFEGSVDSTNGVDGTWTGIRAVQSNTASTATLLATGVMAAAPAFSYELVSDGYQYVRLRVTAVSTGSAVVSLTRTK